MTLKRYSEHIAKLATEYPNAKVVFSSDEEGNSYGEVGFLPSLGHFSDGEWYSEEDLKDNNEGMRINAVCVN